MCTILLTNDGDFGDVAEELLYPNGEGCIPKTVITTTNASDENETDGEIYINVTSGIGQYEYSIDGGLSFGNSSVFDNFLLF